MLTKQKLQELMKWWSPSTDGKGPFKAYLTAEGFSGPETVVILDREEREIHLSLAGFVSLLDAFESWKATQEKTDGQR